MSRHYVTKSDLTGKELGRHIVIRGVSIEEADGSYTWLTDFGENGPKVVRLDFGEFEQWVKNRDRERNQEDHGGVPPARLP